MVTESFNRSFDEFSSGFNPEDYTERVFASFLQMQGTNERNSIGCSCVWVSSLNKMVPGCNACK